MTTVLDRDLAADTYAHFGGRLFAATLYREVPDAIVDPTNVTSTTSEYACDAYAFAYKQEYVEGERVRKGDYQVVILRGSIVMSNDDGVHASLDLSSVTPDVDTVIEAIAEDAAGNAITVSLVGDAMLAAGALVDIGTTTRISFLPGVSTIDDLEALLATSANVRVRIGGTGAVVIGSADELATTALAGGVDPTSATTDFVPAPGDRISVPPPGQSIAKNARIVMVDLVTEAQITVSVLGPKAA